MENIIYSLGSGSNTPGLFNGVASFRPKSYGTSIKVRFQKFRVSVKESYYIRSFPSGRVSGPLKGNSTS